MKTVLVGRAGDEQAWGGTPFSGNNQASLMFDSNTNVVYSLDGHLMNDAPEFELVETKYGKRTVVVNGRNQTQEFVRAPEYTKRVSLKAMTPQRKRSVLSNFYDAQARGATIHLAVVPNECLDGCDRWFWVLREANMTIPRPSTGVVSDGENEAAIDHETTFTGIGDFVRYEGLTTTAVTKNSGDNPIYTIAYDSGNRCDGGSGVTCINLSMIRAGDGFAEVSADGGTTWTAVTITAITTDLATAIITGAVRAGNNWVLTYSDVADGTGTDGGIAYSVNGAAAVIAQATTGSQGVAKAFGSLFAFGTGGTMYRSYDNGITWSAVTTGITEDILAVDFDGANQLMYIAATGGKAYVYDGATFTDISTYVGASTNDLTAVSVVSANKVIFGDGVGSIYENQMANILDTNYTKTVLGSGAVNFIGGDGVGGFRTVVSEGANIWVRDVFTEQEFELQTTMAGIVLAGAIGEQLTGYAAGNFVFGADDGTSIMVQNCNLCVF